MGGEDLTVGAENSDGSGGESTDAAPTGDIRVTSTPAVVGGIAQYSFTVQGASAGIGRVTTTMTSPAVPGQTIEVDEITVNRR